MLRRLLASLAALPFGLAALPAQAIETVQLQLPLLHLSFSVHLSELENPEALWRGTSDLADLNRASRGALGRQLQEVFDTPLPLQTQQVVDQVVGTPLLQQALLAATTLGQVHGLEDDLSGEAISRAVEQAGARGPLTLLSVLRALPGESVTVDLPRALAALKRMVAQRRQAEQWLQQLPPVSAAAPRAALTTPLQRRTLMVPAPHRAQPLEVIVLEPPQPAPGRAVVISHGLWDSPEAFEGWGEQLARQGQRVLLPRHPGSDRSQQRAMLSGDTPPPGPDELRLRPLDVSAVIDAVGAEQVVVIGHSWGATTALQLAGTQPSGRRLKQRCSDLQDPERNISWILQCSFLDAADRAGLADARVRAVVAVSPPTSLLFDTGAAQAMQARVLLVSGSRDWVVPPDPEALIPFGRNAGQGHQLVLVQGGDHFNLRAAAGSDGGPLAPLLLAWTDAVFRAPGSLRPAAGAAPLLTPSGWGSSQLPLVLLP